MITGTLFTNGKCDAHDIKNCQVCGHNQVILNEPKLQVVRVEFADSIYNYETSVSWTVKLSDLRDYFVGSRFDMGSYPIEDMQTCTSIKLIECNPEINPE